MYGAWSGGLAVSPALGIRQPRIASGEHGERLRKASGSDFVSG